MADEEVKPVLQPGYCDSCGNVDCIDENCQKNHEDFCDKCGKSFLQGDDLCKCEDEVVNDECEGTGCTNPSCRFIKDGICQSRANITVSQEILAFADDLLKRNYEEQRKFFELLVNAISLSPMQSAALAREQRYEWRLRTSIAISSVMIHPICYMDGI